MELTHCIKIKMVYLNISGTITEELPQIDVISNFASKFSKEILYWIDSQNIKTNF